MLGYYVVVGCLTLLIVAFDVLARQERKMFQEVIEDYEEAEAIRAHTIANYKAMVDGWKNVVAMQSKVIEAQRAKLAAIAALHRAESKVYDWRREDA